MRASDIFSIVTALQVLAITERITLVWENGVRRVTRVTMVMVVVVVGGSIGDVGSCR